MPNRLSTRAALLLLPLAALACVTLAGQDPDSSSTSGSSDKLPATVDNVGPGDHGVTPIPEVLDKPPEARPDSLAAEPVGEAPTEPVLQGTEAQRESFEKLLNSRSPRRDGVELATAYLGFKGTIDPPPPVVEPLPVGTIQELIILNDDSNTRNPVAFELLAVSDHAYFWFDLGAGSIRPDAGDLAQASRAFDQIYEESVRFFGQENRPGVDGDPRLHIVNASPLALCDVTLDSTRDCHLAGYLDSDSAVPRVVDPLSNGREMFVMNVDNFGSGFYLNVLAHELRHLIEANHDPGDEAWVAEGGATLAEDLLGFSDSPIRRANMFLAEPDQQLNRWPDNVDISYYGKGYLFNRYLFDRLGPELYRQFGTSPEVGFAALDSVAEVNGLDLTGDSLWLDWLVALAIHDERRTPEHYQIMADGLNTVALTEVGRYPAAFDTEVHQYAADYYLLEGDDPVTIDFQGDSLISLLGVEPTSGEMLWLANRSNYSHMRLSRAVDLTGVDSATLEYNVFYDIEQGYDFAYLFLSEDGGLSWAPLVTADMEGLDPADDPSRSTVADRFYTGLSDGWRRERVDLSAYAGRQIHIRFAYVTDPLLTHSGIALDDIAIPEIGFFDDAESDDDGWLAEGFQRVTAEIPQRWHLQLITFPDKTPVVSALPLDGGVTTAYNFDLGESDDQAILIVAAASPMTLLRANYRLNFDG